MRTVGIVLVMSAGIGCTKVFAQGSAVAVLASTLGVSKERLLILRRTSSLHPEYANLLISRGLEPMFDSSTMSNSYLQLVGWNGISEDVAKALAIIESKFPVRGKYVWSDVLIGNFVDLINFAESSLLQGKETTSYATQMAEGDTLHEEDELDDT